MPTRRRFLTHAAQGLGALALAPVLSRAADKVMMKYTLKPTATTLTYKTTHYKVDLYIGYGVTTPSFSASSSGPTSIPIPGHEITGTAPMDGILTFSGTAAPANAPDTARPRIAKDSKPIPYSGGSTTLRLLYPGTTELILACEVTATVDNSRLHLPLPERVVMLAFRVVA